MRHILFTLTVLFSGGSFAADAHGKKAKPLLSFNAFLDSKSIVFIVVNESLSNAEVAHPFPLLYGRGGGGVELSFRRLGGKSGEAKRLCAMIDGGAESIPSAKNIYAKTAIGEKFDLDFIRKVHCLDYGEYEMTAIYHNFAHGKELANDSLPLKMRLKFTK